MSAKRKYPIRGIVVSLNTSFDDGGRVDFRSMGRLVDWHLKEGAAGFLTPAYAGEVHELTLSERIELVAFVRGRVKGRAELIAGASAAEERESFAVAEAAVKMGCEGVLLEVPGALRDDRRRLLDFFRSFASVGMPMLMIQDWEWGGCGMDVSVIAELFEEVAPFRCLKVEVAPAGPKYSAVLAATGGLLHVSGGWAADQMIEALDRGVDAYMPTAMTGLYRRIFEAHSTGDRKTAKRWFHSILPVLAFTRQHLDVSIHFYKRLFHRRGLFESVYVRKQTIPYDAYHERYGEELIQYIEEIEGNAACGDSSEKR